MRIDAGLDTGDILLQRECRLGRKIRRRRWAEAGVDRRGFDGETLRGLENGDVHPSRRMMRRHACADLKKEDGRMDFARSQTTCATGCAAFSRGRGRSRVLREDAAVHRAQPAQRAPALMPETSESRLRLSSGAVRTMMRKPCWSWLKSNLRQAPHDGARIHQRLPAQSATIWDK